MINPDLVGSVSMKDRDDLVALAVVHLLEEKAAEIRERRGGGDMWGGPPDQHPLLKAQECEQMAQAIKDTM